MFAVQMSVVFSCNFSPHRVARVGANGLVDGNAFKREETRSQESKTYTACWQRTDTALRSDKSDAGGEDCKAGLHVGDGW